MSRLIQVGHYERDLGGSLERLLENALDWEHLPYLHASSFGGIELLEADETHWRAKLDEGSEIELRLDPAAARWTTRTLAGRSAGHEIRTQARERGTSGSHVSVEFWVPDSVPAERRNKLGRGYEALYEQLYDEDDEMMVERQRGLDELARAQDTAAPSDSIDLGPDTGQPRRFQLGGREWCLRHGEGDIPFSVHARRCPHWLGPLDDAPIADGELTCPWHGYRFDVASGKPMAPAHNRCRLPRPPRIERLADGRLRAFL